MFLTWCHLFSGLPVVVFQLLKLTCRCSSVYWTHVSVCHLYLELSLSANLCSDPSTCPATSCYLYINTVGTADRGSIQSSHSVNHVFVHAAHIFLLIIQLASCQIANHNLSLEWFLILLLWIVLCDCPAGGFSIFSLKLEVSHAAWDSGWIINVVSVMCWPSSSSGGGEGPPNSSQSHCNSLLERREDF